MWNLFPALIIGLGFFFLSRNKFAVFIFFLWWNLWLLLDLRTKVFSAIFWRNSWSSVKFWSFFAICCQNLKGFLSPWSFDNICFFPHNPLMKFSFFSWSLSWICWFFYNSLAKLAIFHGHLMKFAFFCDPLTKFEFFVTIW